jgi:DNA-binding response OmpR family regulator
MISTHRYKILCVEDSADVCELLSVVLDNNRYEFISVETLAEAVQQCQTQSFDLYILDVRLPDGSGIELAQQIRQLDQHTPIIFESAEASSDSVGRGLAAGAQAYLTKPYNPFVLAETIVTLLHDREEIPTC